MESRSAAEAAGRAAAGKADQGGGQRLYKDPQYGLETSYGAPVKTNKYGVQTALPEKATTGKPAQSWGSWKGQVDNYNNAAKAWNGDLVQNNVLGLALPFGLQNVAPKLNQPSTYTGGTYHFGMNPAAAAGGVAGMFAGPVGPLMGPVAGKAYSLAGGKNLVFSGPDVPRDWDPNGAATANSALSAEQSPASARPTERASIIPGPIQSKPPSIIQPQQQPMPAAQMPSIFTPKPPMQSQFQVPGGKPYGFSIFGRAA